MARKTRRTRRRHTRRRQRGGQPTGLLKHIEEICNLGGEGGTFCIANMENVVDYYKAQSYAFTEATEIPRDVAGLSVIAVKAEVFAKDDRGRFAALRHGFALVFHDKRWYRVDSWQGLHSIVATPVDIKEWLNAWREFQSNIQSGKLRRADLVKLFGEWKDSDEVKKLREAGEWINDYPKDKDGVFTTKTNVWTA